MTISHLNRMSFSHVLLMGRYPSTSGVEQSMEDLTVCDREWGNRGRCDYINTPPNHKQKRRSIDFIDLPCNRGIPELCLHHPSLSPPLPLLPSPTSLLAPPSSPPIYTLSPLPTPSEAHSLLNLSIMLLLNQPLQRFPLRPGHPINNHPILKDRETRYLSRPCAISSASSILYRYHLASGYLTPVGKPLLGRVDGTEARAETWEDSGSQRLTSSSTSQQLGQQLYSSDTSLLRLPLSRGHRIGALWSSRRGKRVVPFSTV